MTVSKPDPTHPTTAKEEQGLDCRITTAARLHPDKIAIKSETQSVSYRELEETSNRIANFMHGKIKKIPHVIILLDRSPGLITAIIGLLKCHLVFVPLNPLFPGKRVKQMIEESRAQWVITSVKYYKKFKDMITSDSSGNKLNILLVDAASPGFDSFDHIFCLDPGLESENLTFAREFNQNCYIYFTSGSTGTPKGVLGRQKSLIQFIQWEVREFGVNDEFNVSQMTPPSFDPFLRDIFLPLMVGGTCCIPSYHTLMDMRELIHWIEKNQITLIHTVPALFKSLVPVIEDSNCFHSLKYILLAGELLRGRDISKFIKIFKNRIQLVNVYGPTETTLAKLFYRIRPGDEDRAIIPVGKPIEGARVLILDSKKRKCRPGKKGEIYIRTPFISSGYYNDPQLNEKVFMKNPYGKHPGDIIYKTGDLGRLLPGGDIELSGRVDFQVKIRGVRIELGEIENHLLKHHEVKEAVVAARDDNTGDKYLCAYIVAQGTKQKVEELREFLSQTLPDNMIPSYFVSLDKIPLTANGKIDRLALPTPGTDAGDSYAAPRDQVEKKLEHIWAAVLGLDKEKIGIDANFFHLGGHSLKASMLVSRIHKEFNARVSLTEIFKTPTIRGLREYIALADEDKYAAIEPVKKKEYYELSSAQKRVYILHQKSSANIAYNMPRALRITGPLDIGQLEKTIMALIERHESLRTSFEIHEGEPVQRIHRSVEFDLATEYTENTDSRGGSLCPPLVKGKVEDRGNHGELPLPEEKIIKDFIRPFDLSHAPLLRVGLTGLSQQEHLMLLDMHHIISDGVSMGVLVDEFIRLYTGCKLPGLRIQYKDFSAWQNKFFKSSFFLHQEKYWLETLKGELPQLAMPMDFARADSQTFAGNRIIFAVPAEITGKLDNLAKEKNVTLNILFLSVYLVLLYKYTNQEDIIVGSLVSGRNHADLGNIIGMFANFLPIRCRINPRSTFSEFLHSSGKTILEAYENQDYPFEEILELVNFPVDLSRNPLFDTMMIFHNQMDLVVHRQIENLKFDDYPLPHRTSKLDFRLDVCLGEKGVLNCILEYNTGLFKEETIKDLVGHFRDLMAEVIKNPHRELADIEMFTGEEKARLLEKRKRSIALKHKSPRLVISATFTPDPIRSYVKWWGKQFDLDIDVVFAPYHQVFQQLLDKESLVSTNKEGGINLLLIRFEDWTRDLQLPEVKKCEELENNFKELVKIFQETPKRVPYFVGLFPPCPHLSSSPMVTDCLEDMQRRWRKELEKTANTYIIDFTRLKELYIIDEIVDPLTDREGHIPFSIEFFAAMATFITRNVWALTNNPFKVIVLDCDGTLWEGICGEDGPLGVKIEPPYLHLQQVMLQKYNEGFLLALCSKNNEADVWEVFEKNPGMALKKEHFAAWRINWNAKSENIKELAQELNLGIDSFIFLDDNPLECTEVMTLCPEVLTLRLPGNPAGIPLYLNHVWAFDKIKITGEDRQRTRMYLAERKREESKQESTSLKDFLADLQLEISMNVMNISQVDRVSQLTSRTNQFNLSTIRRTGSEIVNLVKEPGTCCWVIEVSDRFGDYGLVGVVITKEKEECLFIDTLLLSCRVLGRGVEEVILAGLRKYCRERQLKTLEADYYPTPKNIPLLKFLQEKWIKQKEKGSHITFVYPLENRKESSEFVDFYYMENFKKDIPRDTVEKKVFLPVPKDDSPLVHFSWDIGTGHIDRHKLLHQMHLLPLENHTAEQLLGLPVEEAEDKIPVDAKYEEPGNQKEKELVKIWQKILKAEKIGTNTNFFQMGGNSLRAIRLISEIHKAFKVELSLKNIFDNKTIKQLAQLVDNREEDLYSSINVVEKKKCYPLSSAQKRLYILQQIEPKSIGYNLSKAVGLEGNIDKKRLEEILKKLVRRHESLRTSFKIINQEPVQEIHNDVELVIGHWSLVIGEEESIKAIIQDFIRPFDLSRAPLLRVGLIEEGTQGKYIMMVDMHHIVFDAASMVILFREFMELYEGKTLSPLKLQYKEYAEWMMGENQRAAINKEAHYWLKEFSHKIPVLNLPADYPRPVVQRFEGSIETFCVGTGETRAIKALALKHGATLFMTLLSIYYVFLSRISNQEDIVVGTPVSMRKHEDLQPVMGIFLNTLALRNRIAPGKPFQSLLKEIRTRTLTALDHQAFPFEDLVEEAAVNRDLSRSPLFDTMFILHNELQAEEIPQKEIPGLKLKPITDEDIRRTSKFDLTLIALETKEDLFFTFEYSTALFKRESIKRFARYFKTIVTSVLQYPGMRISRLNILPAEEKQQVLQTFNRTAADYPREKTLHQLFEEQVLKVPDKVALVCADKGLTYRELNKRANHLARVLQIHGVGIHSIVGLMPDRSVEIITGLYAILKVGGAYLPIGLEYPSKRIAYMLKESRAALLLTHQRENLVELSELPCGFIDFDHCAGEGDDSSNLPLTGKSTDTAYVIYTSGSTGGPKGVVIRHQSVVHFIKAMAEIIQFEEQDTILSLTTLSFDIFGLEALFPLTVGVKIAIGTGIEQMDPGAAAAVIQRERITLFQVTPSRLQLLVSDVKAVKSLRNLRYLLVGGEAFPELLLRKVRQVTNGKIYNLYGPAETTIWSTAKDLTGDRPLNIGQPIANTRVYILGKNHSPQPIGIPGELCIGGHGLALGYLNQPELTFERFLQVSALFNRSYRSYRSYIYQTGDLARWLSNGELEFLGRIDFQVKIRGHRIELEEIENQLLRLAEIREAVVTALEGGRHLCAYIVSRRTFAISELREHLSLELPGYMIPSYFIHLERMPLNPNGKIDRKALPGVEASRSKPGKTYTAPATDLESTIADTWKQVLKLDDIGVHDNFFELGGTSMGVINVNQGLREKLQRDVPVVILYRYMTIRSLARALQGKEINRPENRVEDINSGKKRLKSQFNRRKRI